MTSFVSIRNARAKSKSIGRTKYNSRKSLFETRQSSNGLAAAPGK
jgi:hypothetical protein